MTTKTQARPSRRALVGAAACAALTGAIGLAYLGGVMTRDVAVRAKAERLAEAADAGYAEPALVSAAVGMDYGAFAVARRHDPYTVAGAAQRDRQAAVLAKRLNARMDRTTARAIGSTAQAAGLRATLAGRAGPAARPFRAGFDIDSTRDLECLTQAVYFEARGEGTAGMKAVAQVVLNRVRHPAFPKSICGVVFQGAHQRVGCQFSFACDGSIRRRTEPGAWNRARQVASQMLSGYVMTEVGNATHFHTTAVNPNWSSRLLRVATVGSHVFYRFNGAAGRPGSFHYTPRPSDAGESLPGPTPVYAGLPAPDQIAGAAAEAGYSILFGRGDAAEATARAAQATEAPAARAETAAPAKAEATTAPATPAQPTAAAATAAPAKTETATPAAH